MKLLRHIVIGLGVAGFVLAALTVVLFNRSAFGWQALSVPTGSMRPTMSPGSLVLTHRVPISSLKVGDVITHTNPLTMRTTLTHRIVKVYKMNGKILAFITKGDANPSPDPPVVGGLVQGKMVGHVPYAGKLLMWAKTWTGIAVLVYLPALLVMVHETRLLAAYLRQTKPYRLEDAVRLQPSAPKPRVRPKRAVAASSVFVAALAVTGWQTAGALAGQSSQTLLLLPSNVITATAPVSSPSGTQVESGAAGCASSASEQTAGSASQNPVPGTAGKTSAKTICYNSGHGPQNDRRIHTEHAERPS